jgi:hypothetical protein
MQVPSAFLMRGERRWRAALHPPPAPGAPLAVSSIFPTFTWNVVLSHSRIARRPTKNAGDIMPAAREEQRANAGVCVDEESGGEAARERAAGGGLTSTSVLRAMNISEVKSFARSAARGRPRAASRPRERNAAVTEVSEVSAHPRKR